MEHVAYWLPTQVGKLAMDREGLDLGTITPACIVEQQGPESLPTEAVGEPHEAGGYPHVARVYPGDRAAVRHQCLKELLRGDLAHMLPVEKGQLTSLLPEYHDAFCLDEDERDETDLLQFVIDTADCRPLR